MEIVYHVKQAYAGAFKDLLFALSAYSSVSIDNKNLPFNYQRLYVTEDVVTGVAYDTGISYWEDIMRSVLLTIVQARATSVDNWSEAKNIPVYIFADKEILSDFVPLGTELSGVSTVNLPFSYGENNERQTWGDVVTVIKEFPDGTVAFRPYNGNYLNELQLLTLCAYKEDNPYNISFLTHKHFINL
jgi:hypothetical protein